MKKILVVILMIGLLATSVLAFGAVRTIDGNKVTLKVDVMGTDVIALEETIGPEMKALNVGQGGNYLSKKNTITWIKLDTSVTEFTYEVEGAGKISGVMNGGLTGEDPEQVVTTGNHKVGEEGAGTGTGGTSGAEPTEPVSTAEPENLVLLKARITSILLKDMDKQIEGYEFENNTVGKISKIAKALKDYLK